MGSFSVILKVLQKVCCDGNLEPRAVGNFGLMSATSLYHTVGTEEKYLFRRVVKVTDKDHLVQLTENMVHNMISPSLQIASSPDAHLLT